MKPSFPFRLLFPALLCLCVSLSLTGCSGDDEKDKDNGGQTNNNNEQQTSEDSPKNETPVHPSSTKPEWSAEQRSAAVSEIQKLQGTVEKNSQGDVIAVDLSDKSITDSDLRHLEGFLQLEELNLTNTKVTDEGLGYLKYLTNLKEVVLLETAVTDEGKESLQKSLPNTEIILK